MEKTMTPTNDIPLEGVLKWLKRDRDRLQAKLDKIIPYAKSLEAKVREMEASLEEIKDGRIKSLEAERQNLLQELAAFRSDYRQTQWYIQMDADRERLRKENKGLKKAYTLMFNALKNLDDGKENII